MKNFVILVVAVVALPCALAIMCNECTPSGMQNMCQGQLNSTNCSGIFDACATTAMAIGIKFPKMQMTMRVMTCAVKSYCAKLKAQACENGTAELIKALPGAKVDACDVQCCDDKDNCNTKDLVKLPGPSDKPTIALAAYTGASLAISIVSLLAGIAISAY